MFAPRSNDTCPECGSPVMLEWQFSELHRNRYRIFCGHWRLTGCERNPPWQTSEAKAVSVWKMKKALLK